MKRVVSTLVSICVARLSIGQHQYIVQAPALIKLPEYTRLLELSQSDSLSKETISESRLGDAIINLKSLGVVVISRDSELMAPVRLARELYALSKKYDNLTLIPFTELSDVAVQQFRRDLRIQFPKHDVGPNSSFVMHIMFGKEVQSGLFVSSSYYAPSRFGSKDPDAKKTAFSALLSSKPLVVARKDDEVQAYLLKEALTREGVFYDQNLTSRRKLELNRKALEMFEGWVENELNKIDDQIYSERSSDPLWTNILKTRGIKNIDDLKQSAPDQYNDMLRDLRLNWQNYGMKSPNGAEDVLAKASVGFHFHFSIAVGIEGTNQRFTFGPKR